MGKFREAYITINEKLSSKGGIERPLNVEVLNSVENEKDAFIYLLKAPTGYGKTSVSWALALGATKDCALFNNVIHVLPLRSIIEDIQGRSKEYFPENFSAVKMMGVSEEIFHLYPFNITTVDTFVWDTLKLNTKKIKRIREGKEFGYDFLTQATILNSIVFLDEAHYIIEDEMMREAFGIVLNFFFSFRVPIIISSATIPQSHKEVFEWFARRNGYIFKTFEPPNSDPYIERERKKKLAIEFKSIKPFDPKVISHMVSESERTLLVVNNVKRAVDIYNSLEEKKVQDKLLLHGKMRPSHRKTILDRLRNLKDKPFVLVSTQVIEAGVDTSSDNLITELAPPNQLIQRMGRVARYDEKKANIKIIDTGERAPYSQNIIQESLKWLEANRDAFHPRLPELYQPFLDEVYKGTAKLKDSLCKHHRVANLLLDLRTRSNEILEEIEYIVRQEGFLRKFTLPVSVDGEIILFSPIEAEILYNEGRLEVKGYNKQEKPNFYRLAKLLALGEDIELTYIGEYDKERGIVVWE